MSREEKWLLKEKYDGVKTSEFETDLERLGGGEPLGYVIGHVPFLGCEIYLDSRPLIPRVETEFWVEKAIAVVRGAAASPPRILDLCAGSGAIGVAVAKAVPEAHVTFTEIDKVHLPTIEKNLITNLTPQQPSSRPCLELGKKYRVLEADLFSSRQSRQGLELGEYDFILSNPPYIDPALDRTEESVKRFEPSLALYGGKKGFELIEKIITESKNYLTKTGQLWLEHEPEQVEALEKLAKEKGFEIEARKDQYGIFRYSILKSMAK